MKQILLYATLILISLTSCQKEKSKIIITGKITGDIPNEILYSIPINGICYDFFSSSTKVDSLGNFEFSVNIETPCFISLYLSGNRGNFIAEPGGKYYLSIESKDFENYINYNCKNKEVQKMYQELASPIHPQFVARDILNSPIHAVNNKIDSMTKIEIDKFDKLLKKRNLSKEMYDLIKLDRALYYGCVQGQIAMLKFFNVARKSPEANTDSINQMWNDATSRIPLNSKNLLKSKWAYYYLENYLMFKEYTAQDFSFETRSKAREDGNIHRLLLDISKNNLDSNILEFYNASYILTKARQHKYEKELIALAEEFKSDFPNSNYTLKIQPQIDKIVEFHRIAEKGFEEGIRFVDNYENINSFDECLKPFKGKKVYVDIWTTSCGPCKKEFEFNAKLKEILKSQNVEMLYISKDRDREDQRWKDMIKYYHLTGNHVRANKEFTDDLRKIMGRFGIPRYLIIDENGKIINDNAKRPSEIKELEKQLLLNNAW